MQRLLLRVPEESLGSGVPTHHPARQIEKDDRVIGDLLDEQPEAALA